jgi:hypothetical protein
VCNAHALAGSRRCQGCLSLVTADRVLRVQGSGEGWSPRMVRSGFTNRVALSGTTPLNQCFVLSSTLYYHPGCPQQVYCRGLGPPFAPLQATSHTSDGLRARRAQPPGLHCSPGPSTHRAPSPQSLLGAGGGHAPASAKAKVGKKKSRPHHTLHTKLPPDKFLGSIPVTAATASQPVPPHGYSHSSWDCPGERFAPQRMHTHTHTHTHTACRYYWHAQHDSWIPLTYLM